MKAIGWLALLAAWFLSPAILDWDTWVWLLAGLCLLGIACYAIPGWWRVESQNRDDRKMAENRLEHLRRVQLYDYHSQKSSVSSVASAGPIAKRRSG